MDAKVIGSGRSPGWFLELDQRRIDLHEGEFTLGRSRGCGVVLRDPSVSRGHALLCIAGGRVTLQDLRSSNGTFVNGRRLDGEVGLAAGDRLVLGETQLFLRRAGDGEGTPPATGDAGVFCPACGLPVQRGTERCASCGASLAGRRLPRRSEALGLGEVLPVGEVLGAPPSGSWDLTSARGRSAGPRGVASPPAPEPGPNPDEAAGEDAEAAAEPATAKPHPFLSDLPMSVREADERSADPTPLVPSQSAPVPAPPAERPPGIWRRLVGRWRGRS